MKHKFFALITILLLPVLLAACVFIAPAEVAEAAPTAEVEATAGEATADPFPVTIAHKMGSTTIAAKPARVSLGFTDQDYLIALGVVPVGIRDWFGEQPNAVWPWAQPLLNGAEPEVLPREFNFEQIARLQPDLIVAIYTSLTQEEYDLLSAIAPVVTAPPDLADYAITWQEQTRYTGQIVGQSARAAELVTRLEAKMAQARADHPEFADTAYAFTSVYGGEYYLYGEQSTASRFLTTLGFVVPAEILELTENDNDYFVFSPERMDLVVRPLTVWSHSSPTPCTRNCPCIRQVATSFLGWICMSARFLSAPFSASTCWSMTSSRRWPWMAIPPPCPCLAKPLPLLISARLTMKQDIFMPGY